MKGLSVLLEVLGATHQFPHVLEDGSGLLVDLRPGPTEPMDGRCAQS